jgi:hypothetical protein
MSRSGLAKGITPVLVVAASPPSVVDMRRAVDDKHDADADDDDKERRLTVATAGLCHARAEVASNRREETEERRIARVDSASS